MDRPNVRLFIHSTILRSHRYRACQAGGFQSNSIGRLKVGGVTWRNYSNTAACNWNCTPSGIMQVASALSTNLAQGAPGEGGAVARRLVPWPGEGGAAVARRRCVGCFPRRN